MPNATLCGKAVVEMILGKLEGMEVRDIQEQLVENGNLPKAYTVSEERLERCQKIDSVKVQDWNGEAGVDKSK